MEKIGFIGLGIMGNPMVRNLLKRNVSVVVNDIKEELVMQLEEAGAEAGTYEELGQACDIIFTILPDGDALQEVLFGSHGAVKTMDSGKLVCDMSSVTPGESQLCYKKLKAKGIGFIDAPVSGGESGAIAGTLAIMCGGEQEHFERLQPYFDIMGNSSILVGESGSGSMTKLANQIIVNLGIAAVSEAFVLAKKAGTDPMKVYEAIRGGLAGSAVLDAKLPKMCNRDFKAGGKISINYKDIRNVMDTAELLQVPLPFTQNLLEVFKTMSEEGHDEEDHGAIVKYFEKLTNM